MRNLFLSIVITIQWTMPLLLSRLARVRSSWIATSPALNVRQQKARQIRDSARPWGYVDFCIPQHSLLSGRKFQSSSSLPLVPRWNVGDSVQVQLDDNQTLGVIKEDRGRGWYSIAIPEGNTIIKCRGTQLSPTPTAAAEATATITSPVQEQMTTIFSGKENEPEATLRIDPGSKPDLVPPPPTIDDLDAVLLGATQGGDASSDVEFLEQLAHHSSFQKWVVFTDLHCAPSTLDTSLQVLSIVHELAVAKNAGTLLFFDAVGSLPSGRGLAGDGQGLTHTTAAIKHAGVLFLGDFWHHRGTLRVDCLNAVLEHLQGWKVPMVLIPGNHDQVTLGGYSHGLTALENSYRIETSQGGTVPGPLVFSYPTKFRNALFVPHIRDIATMESILQSTLAQEVSSLFVHADVTGAMMNDLIVSQDGVPPSSFPANKRIYSGHFHKPHTVQSGNVKIEYLGSPYETSLSEAQQTKSLAILDNSWQCLEYVPLDIGRKHFKVSNWQDLLQLHSPSQGSHYGSRALIKSGDRIVVTVSKSDLDTIQPAISSHIKILRQAGATVEIRELKNLPTDLMGIGGVGHASKLEEMTPESTWRAFIAESITREAISDDSASALLTAGLELLEGMETEDFQKDRGATLSDLQLTSVTVEGFGPFYDPTTYPLLGRGLVLLRGTNNDGGSDSNGTGKSSLAMSALWALTGALDPRRVQDAKTSDVVNDDSKSARVTVHGTINNAPFAITRTKTLSKGNLVFQVNGVDMTTQSVKETQVLIEEQLGITPQILSRTIFHGQHSQNELLEATDAKLKEELSLVVPLGLWQESATMARAKSRDASKKAAELTGMINLRTGDIQKLANRMAAAKEAVEAKQKDLDTLQCLLDDEEARIGGARYQAQSSDTDFESLEMSLHQATSKLKEAESKYQIMLSQRDDELGPLQRSYKELSHSLLSLTQRCQTSERELFAASMQADTIKEEVDRLQKKWDVDLSSGLPAGFVLPDTCPTCQQPISKDGHGHSHFDLQRVAEKDIEQALRDLKDARAAQEGAALKQTLANDALSCREKTVKEMEEDLDMATARWDTEQLKMEQDIAANRQGHSLRSEELSTVARQAQRLAHFNTLHGRINSETAATSYANATYISVRDEVQEGHVMLEQLMAQMESENFRSRTMSELGELFGQRGVQTFVLQNIVDSLNGITQAYLDELSDGTQRLNLSVDSGDRISRTAFVLGGDGNFKARPLSTLSGGQWRRCSLALSLAFAELVARRGKLRPSLCVLDEPLTHLDRSGRTKVGQLIRKMLHQGEPGGVGLGSLGMSTVILILQDLSAEELEESFDCIDEVVRDGGTSCVRVDVP